MSNPYDPNQPPADPNEPPTGATPPPYGEQPAAPAPPPYGATPYGQPADQGAPPYGGPPFGAPVPGGEMPKGTDPVSIVGFVLSLTCCLSFVGVILGFVGLSRTKGGKRKARWAAVSAVAIGIPLTIATIVGGVFLGIYVSSIVSVDEARSGMCVDINDDDEGVVLFEKECNEAHDGEIIFAGDAGDDADTLESSDATSVCVARIDQESSSIVLSGDYELNALLEDPDDVDEGDRFVCYIEPSDGDKVSEKILP